MNIFRTIRIATGDVLCSKSGRLLAPVPKVALETTRKCNASLHRLFHWLLEEARAEARHLDDDYALTLFAGITVTNLSQSDKHVLNDYLFGCPDGATVNNLPMLEAA